ncbi:MAG TPA: hypothetical protein VIM11_25955 [Tepidisphaeraceae bacterium]
MVTGSFVSSVQGEPRASHDIDMVVSLNTPGVNALLKAFPAPRYYLDPSAIESARASNAEFRQFNVLDAEEGDKIDFWLLSDAPFDQSRFERRYEDDVDGVRAMISQPEDTILMKLLWAKMSGGSEKQLGDAVRVYEVQFADLDIPYMEHWATRLDVQSYWLELKSRTKPL